MTRLFTTIILILLPLLIMLGVYLVFDPFEVVYPYEVHYNDPNIPYNWDYNQFEMLIRNYDARKYDSFIFGNSRSMAFLCSDWSRHIDSPRTLHFAAAKEGIYGIHAKVMYLSREKMPIRNALLVLDPWTLSLVANTPGFLYIKHPKTSGESLLTFHQTFFRSFIELKFFFGYLDYKLTGRVRPYFKDMFAEGITVDRVTGDKRLLDKEKSIEETPKAYYNNLAAVFYPRDLTAAQDADPVISEIQVGYLKDIRKVFDENRTNYQIIISPTYDAKQLNPKDLAKITELFGADRVYDFSGINRFTRDIHNYYENSHFRIRVGKEIMDNIYAGRDGSGRHR
jgi:hypothetical protein